MAYLLSHQVRDRLLPLKQPFRHLLDLRKRNLDRRPRGEQDARALHRAATLDVYSHVMPDMQEQGAVGIETALGAALAAR